MKRTNEQFSDTPIWTIEEQNGNQYYSLFKKGQSQPKKRSAENIHQIDIGDGGFFISGDISRLGLYLLGIRRMKGDCIEMCNINKRLDCVNIELMIQSLYSQ